MLASQGRKPASVEIHVETRPLPGLLGSLSLLDVPETGSGAEGRTESIVLTPSEASVKPLESVTFVATVPPGVTLGWAVQEAGGGTIDLSGH